jgi:hypothetical protein
MDTAAMVGFLILFGLGAFTRIPGGDSLLSGGNTRPPVSKRAGIGLPKKAALYTMNFLPEQCVRPPSGQ